MFYRRRSIQQILTDGIDLYTGHWWLLTKPLVFPLLAQLFGVIFWIFLTYEVTDVITAVFPDVNIWWLWGGFVLANLPGMYLFFNGFWRYLVWICGLNLIVRDVAESGHTYEEGAYYLRIISRSFDYSIILTFIFGIVFIPFGLSLIPVAVGGSFPQWQTLSIITAVVILFFSMIVVFTVLVFLSLSYQVFAFTPGAPGTTMVRSSELIQQDVLKTLLVIGASLLMTQFVIPSVVAWVFDVTRIMALCIHVAGYGVEYIIGKNLDAGVQLSSYPVLALMVDKLNLNAGNVTVILAKTVVLSFVSALLLPLGTAWFALLYADLKSRLEARQSPADEFADESLIIARM